MATIRKSILGAMTMPDSSGEVYFQPMEVAMVSLTAIAIDTLLCCTMEFPVGNDRGLYGKFDIPQDYAGTPEVVPIGVITANTGILGFGFRQISRSDNEPMDTSLEAEDITSISTTAHAAFDIITPASVISVTPAAAFVAGDEVFYFFYRDDSVDTQTSDFHLTGLYFQYSDT